MMRTKWCIVVLALVLVFYPAAFGFTQYAGTENGVLSGKVTDVSGKPVADAEVYVYNTSNTRRPADFISAPTGSSGLYQVAVPPGTYWVVARLRKGEEKFGPLLPGDKHSGAPLEIEIRAGDNWEEDFIVSDLEETSKLAVKFDTSFVKIKGQLLTENGEPIADAYAFANRTEAPKRIPDYVSAWTGSDGWYTLFLPPGTYYFGLATEFPPGKETVPFQEVEIDKSDKNINIIIDE